MRESFTYGSVGRAPRKRCLYPELDFYSVALLKKTSEFKRSALSRSVRVLYEKRYY